METTITFADGDQITSGKLNEITTGMSFDSGDITGTTLSVVGGQLKVGTITSAEMGALSIATGSLIDLSVTTGKIALGAVGSAQIAGLSITEFQLALQAVAFGNMSSSALSTKIGAELLSAVTLLSPSIAQYLPGASKAYGEFNISGTGRSIKANSQNIASLTRIDATHTTVTLATNMSAANYTVIACGISDGTEQVDATVYDKAAGSFKIRHTTEGTDRAINFTVFGKYE